MPWRGINHAHYNIPMEKEEETLEFWTEVMGFDQPVSNLRPDGRKVIKLTDGTYTQIYIFSVDFDNSDHQLMREKQPLWSWADEDQVPSSRRWMQGYHHVAFGVDYPEELDPIQDRLDEYDVPNRRFNRHNVAINLYFIEPVNEINMEIHSPGPMIAEFGEFSSPHESDSEELQTSEEIEKGAEKESEGIVRRGSPDGVAKQLAAEETTRP